MNVKALLVATVYIHSVFFQLARAYPELPIRLARCVVLFPGAAQQSTTTLPGDGAKRCAGRQEA